MMKTRWTKLAPRVKEGPTREQIRVRTQERLQAELKALEAEPQRFIIRHAYENRVLMDWFEANRTKLENIIKREGWRIVARERQGSLTTLYVECIMPTGAGVLHHSRLYETFGPHTEESTMAAAFARAGIRYID